MRTIARAKAGFYPTPESVTRAIANLIQNPPGHAGRLCDPCCGLGEPAGTLAQSLGLVSFGIELDRDRFQESKTILNETLRSDAFATTIQKQSMSLVFLNPPYDDLGKRQRSEPAWLRLPASRDAGPDTGTFDTRPRTVRPSRGSTRCPRRRLRSSGW